MSIANNKKAYHDYFVLEKYEAGIVLMGTEIKSIREGKVNIKDSYARIKDNECLLLNMHISKYKHGNRFNHEEDRERKLLLHKKEIKKLGDIVKKERLSLIPLNIYITKGVAKVEIGLCKGKKLYDKRNSLKEKDQLRRAQSAMKNY